MLNLFFYISSHDYLLLDIQLSVHIWVRSFIQILCLWYQIWFRKILICLHERTLLQFFPDQKAKLCKFLSNFIWFQSPRLCIYVKPFWDSTLRLRQDRHKWTVSHSRLGKYRRNKKHKEYKNQKTRRMPGKCHLQTYSHDREPQPTSTTGIGHTDQPTQQLAMAEIGRWIGACHSLQTKRF